MEIGGKSLKSAMKAMHASTFSIVEIGIEELSVEN